jgi:hypothetical protein
LEYLSSHESTKFELVINLKRRIVLVIAGLTYAGVIVLLICAGLLFGFAAVGANLAIDESSPPVPLVIDVIAAGCAVASFGTFFSMPCVWSRSRSRSACSHAARWSIHLRRRGKCSDRRACYLHARQLLATAVVDRLQLPFGALAFSAVR